MHIILKLHLSIAYYPTAIIVFFNAFPKLIISIIACAAKKLVRNHLRQMPTAASFFMDSSLYQGGLLIKVDTLRKWGF